MNEGERAVRPESTSQRGYIPTLDGWRAIAVLLVIGSHSVTMLRNGGTLPGNLAAGLFNHAGYGVDIFFALSGFLITTLLLTERERASGGGGGGGIDLRRFYVRRFFRIVPPMACYLLVVGLLGALALLPGITGRELLASLFFARNYIPGTSYTGHFWSLSIEEHFYAVIPLLLLLLRRRAMLAVSLAAIAACIAIRAWELSQPLGTFGALPQFRTENRIDALMWGSVLAQATRDPAIVARLTALLRLPLLLALGAATVLLLVAVEDQALRRTVVALVLPVFVAYTVFRPETLVGRALELAPVRFVGRLSYSLYIWQMMFLPRYDRPLGVVQDFPLALIAPFVLALASYYCLEKPMIRLGHRLSGRRPPITGPAVTAV